jgi:hypothetical protein
MTDETDARAGSSGTRSPAATSRAAPRLPRLLDQLRVNARPLILREQVLVGVQKSA